MSLLKPPKLVISLVIGGAELFFYTYQTQRNSSRSMCSVVIATSIIYILALLIKQYHVLPKARSQCTGMKKMFRETVYKSELIFKVISKIKTRTYLARYIKKFTANCEKKVFFT